MKKATYVAPFTKIAQSPEVRIFINKHFLSNQVLYGLILKACSSYTFPRLMGTIKASEFLLFNRKLTAKEAFERNLGKTY